ncbi:TRAP transporter large permease [Microbaculum sp. FT89]|uniref:TRAP transporter large permease n=1 Tax=Microbaculum sp. FT89 TaxID=3447298 RepID=UPI003F52C3DC
MDPITIALIGIGCMFMMIVAKVPIGIAMAMTGFLGYAFYDGVKPALSILVSEPVGIIQNFEFAVIPLFLLMGSFATTGGLSAEIYRLAYAFIGHRRGGLAMATMGGCALFGAVCGSSPATAATFGRVALPQMLQRGYAPSFAAGCIAAGGTLGALVPPSIIMIIYAVLARVPILDVFMAAVIPAILAVLLHGLTIALYTRYNPDAGPAGERTSWRERLIVLRDSWAVIVLLSAVIGGIYGGVFTVNEAAAVGAMFAFLLALFRRRLTWTTFLGALGETAANTAVIYLIIFGASIFSYFFTITGAPAAIVTAIGALDVPPLVIIFALLLMYLALGAVFETVSAMLITLPFVLPLVTALGYDPIWWAIVNIVVIELGMITPPIGLNVFVIKGVADNLSLGTIFRGVSVFVASDIVRLIILTLFPILSLALL